LEDYNLGKNEKEKDLIVGPQISLPKIAPQAYRNPESE
jgi:hypothetical protein